LIFGGQYGRKGRGLIDWKGLVGRKDRFRRDHESSLSSLSLSFVY